MPKDYTCPCGAMEVTFHKGSIVKVKGGWQKGQPVTHLRCFTCEGEVRTGYTIQMLDNEGNPLVHISKKGPKRGKKPTRKPNRKKDSDDAEAIVWRFSD